MKKMITFLCGIYALAGLSGCAFFSNDCDSKTTCEASETVQKPPRPCVHPDSSSWPSLFSADLNNAIYEKGVWRVDAKGVLTATKDQAIWTKNSYKNFILDFEYCCDPAANSGVLIYATDINNWIPNTVEIQILDDNHPHWQKEAPQNKNGGLYGHLAPRVNNTRAAGEWNRMTVTAKGKNLTIAVNGEITAEADLAKWTSATQNPDGSKIPPWLSRPWAELPTEGKIGFQGKHGQASISFRNIRIQSL